MTRTKKPFIPDSPKYCGDKRAYASRQQAEAVKADQEIINTNLRLAVYRCINCGQWHLTRTKEN